MTAAQDATAVELARARLREWVAVCWPDLHARLGQQLDAFVDLAAGNAATHRIDPGDATLRFVNLCCAFGANFERRPENEWALAILSDERLQDWVKLHQLVVQGATELKRRAGAGAASSDQLLHADGALLSALDRDRRSNNSEAIPVARFACDLETVDIRLLEIDWRREYRLIDGSWQLVVLADPVAATRMGSGRPAPPLVCVLAHAPSRGPAARLQVRLLTHAVCDHDQHPFVVFAGDHGLWSWRGHLARSVSWLVHAAEPVAAGNGLGLTLIEESLPQTSLLRATSCGLRDEGVPTGALETYVWAFAADQWLFVCQREADLSWQWPHSGPPAGTGLEPVTKCRIECNGQAVASTRWVTAYHETLDLALVRGFDALFAAWQASTSDASMLLRVSMLSGRSAITWGWREGPDGLAGRPLMRVLGDLDLRNAVDLVLSGELVLGLARTRVRLSLQGAALLQQQFARDRMVPGLMDVVLPVAARWRFDYRLEFDPVAVEDGVVWSEAGPCVGALVGEVGLRPNASGGAGWQWFARLDAEAVTVPISLHDPVLGQTRRTLALLPATKLLDWSLG